FSVAVMLESGMAPRRAPWLGFSFAQLNERVYVTRPDGTDPGVFFWRSAIASPVAILPRLGLGLPYFWQKLSLAVDNERLRFAVRSEPVIELDLSSSP